MFEVVRSPAASERVDAAVGFLERFPPATDILIVSAYRHAADDLARRVTAARGASFGLHRASLTQVAVRCAAADLVRRGMAPTTGLAAEALAARVAFEAARDRALLYFAPVVRFPGFAAALAATLAELRLARVAPARRAICS